MAGTMEKRVYVFLALHFLVSLTSVQADSSRTKNSGTIMRKTHKLENEDESHGKDFTNVVRLIAVDSSNKIDFGEVDDNSDKELTKKINSSKIDSSNIDSMMIDSSKETLAMRLETVNAFTPFDHHRKNSKNEEGSEFLDEVIKVLTSFSEQAEISDRVKEYPNELLDQILNVQFPLKVYKTLSNNRIDNSGKYSGSITSAKYNYDYHNMDLWNDIILPSKIVHDTSQTVENPISRIPSIKNEEISKTDLRTDDYTGTPVDNIKILNEEMETVFVNFTAEDFLVVSTNDVNTTLVTEASSIIRSPNSASVSAEIKNIVINSAMDKSSAEISYLKKFGRSDFHRKESKSFSEESEKANINLNMNRPSLPDDAKKNNNDRSSLVYDIGSIVRFGSYEIYNDPLIKDNIMSEKRNGFLHPPNLDKPVVLIEDSTIQNLLNEMSVPQKPLVLPAVKKLSTKSTEISAGEISKWEKQSEEKTRRYLMDILMDSVNEVIGLNNSKKKRSYSHEKMLNIRGG